MGEEQATVWTEHIWILRASADGHLGSAHLLAIGNGTALNPCSWMFAPRFCTPFSIPLGLYCGVELPFGSEAGAQSTEPHQPGLYFTL